MNRPVLIVSGDFNLRGGMDRPNYELAWHLAERGRRVCLVSHHVAEPLASHPGVLWERVPRPWGVDALGGLVLARAGRRVATRLHGEGARVVVNGGNCAWPDVNWVHAVHAAWERRDGHAPALFRLRSALLKGMSRRNERRSVRAARLVVTNSQRARRQIIDRLAIPPGRVHTVYYGIDPEEFRPPTPNQREAARRRLGWPPGRPVVVFIGALGLDRNKGFDVLFAAWEELCRDPGWDADLAVAGGGAEVPGWRDRAERLGLRERVRVLGFTNEIPDLLAAADALVSPTHYDAYGQGVHEALCCGLPAFVTRCAGVAERYPPELDELLLNDPPSVAEVVRRLRGWHVRRGTYQERVAAFGKALRRRSWADMAEEIITLMTHSPECGVFTS